MPAPFAVEGAMRGVRIRISAERCDGCGACMERCLVPGALRRTTEGRMEVGEASLCVKCFLCRGACPNGAITLVPDF